MSFKMSYEETTELGIELVQTVKIPPDRYLGPIRTHIEAMMLEVQQNIHKLGYDNMSTKYLRPMIRMRAFEIDTRSRKDPPHQETVLTHVSKYYRLYRMLQAVLCENYQNFLYYCADLRKQAAEAQDRRIELENRTKKHQHPQAAEAILNEGAFKICEDLAIKAIGNHVMHPKVEALLESCRYLDALRTQGIIFIRNIGLGEYLTQMIYENGFKAASLLGPKQGNKQAHESAVRRLRSGAVQFLVASSVLEDEGLYPETKSGGIICYGLPYTAAAKHGQQSRGIREQLTYIRYLVASQSPDGSFHKLQLAEKSRLQEIYERQLSGTTKAQQLPLYD